MLLELKNLKVEIDNRTVIDDISFGVEPGQGIGLVGESGSGKTITSLAIMGLLPKSAKIADGEILFEGQDLLKKSKQDHRKLLGNDIAMIFQNPMTALDPLMRVGKQIAEVIQVHNPKISKIELKSRVLEIIKQSKLPDPEQTAKKYPHEMSGGQRQRIVIAMAIANEPKLLIADECTTALDATVQFQIINLLQELKGKMALIFISHSPGVVKTIADNIGVMHKGSIVEYGKSEELLSNPTHPHTKMLLSSLPERAVKGQPFLL
ncbi:MAG: ABC transporter ATP-binding protein [Defluviitaleaceae bacterium]|nr:ABC transporter ATP-binding protein [Defluviitaleaceae bacterium]